MNLPDFVRDGVVHEVQVLARQGGTDLCFEATLRSDYRYQLDDDGPNLSGWIFDVSDPTYPVQLAVEADGVVVAYVSADLNHDDASGGEYLNGFQIETSGFNTLGKTRIVDIKIKNTDFSPFGKFLIGLDTYGYVEAIETDVEAGDRSLVDRIIRPALVEGIRRGDGSVSIDLPWHRTSIAKRSRLQRAPEIDVIIPVYKGRKETLDCIKSAITGRGQIKYRVVIVYDDGPDPLLKNDILELAEAGELEFVDNPENLGFVRSVNVGMSFSQDNDVVLLNSDTVVPHGWLDRLYHAAYTDERIGTVTALSNNATICSLPDISGTTSVPYGSSLQDLDAIMRKVNASEIVDLPSAHGFCMFIKRDAIMDVGLFDADAFGRGYGEENDFSLRAAARGWRNVAACDVFVQHLGSISFGGAMSDLVKSNLKVLERRYPDYHDRVMDFIRRDPLSVYRNNVQKEFWRNKRIAVLVSLSVGGGVEKHVKNEAAALDAEGVLPLILSRQRTMAGEVYQLQSHSEDGGRLTYPFSEKGLAGVIADAMELKVEWITVHHLLDLSKKTSEMIQRCGIPYQVILHDYFFICPRITLLDDAATYCGIPDTLDCNRCLARDGKHPNIEPSYDSIAYDIEMWRGWWAGFLLGAAKIFAPSAATKDLYARVLPDVSFSVWPHERVIRSVALSPAEPDAATVRVAIIGAIGPHKGFSSLLDLLRHAERWAKNLEFVLVGFSSEDALIARYENISMTGPYSSEQAAQVIAEARCDVALFLSPWPETYSYTLTEALAAGLTPVVLDVGAAPERLKQLDHGIVLPADAGVREIISGIMSAKSQPPARFGFEFNPLRDMGPKPVVDLSNPRTLDRPDGYFADGWLRRESRWNVFLPFNAVTFGVDIYVRDDMSGQFLTVVHEGKRLGRFGLIAGEVNTLQMPVAFKAGVQRINLTFDYEAPLHADDVRQGSAVLAGLSVTGSSQTFLMQQDLGWQENE